LEDRLPTTPPAASLPRAPLCPRNDLISRAGAALFEQRNRLVKDLVSQARTVQRMFRASIGRNAVRRASFFAQRRNHRRTNCVAWWVPSVCPRGALRGRPHCGQSH